MKMRKRIGKFVTPEQPIVKMSIDGEWREYRRTDRGTYGGRPTDSKYYDADTNSGEGGHGGKPLKDGEIKLCEPWTPQYDGDQTEYWRIWEFVSVCTPPEAPATNQPRRLGSDDFKGDLTKCFPFHEHYFDSPDAAIGFYLRMQAWGIPYGYDIDKKAVESGNKETASWFARRRACSAFHSYIMQRFDLDDEMVAELRAVLTYIGVD